MSEEKVSFDELLIGRLDERSFLSSLIMNSLGKFNELDYFNIVPDETKEITVELLINGKSVSLRSWLEHFEREFDRQVEVKAGELLRQKLNTDEYSSLNDIHNMLKDLKNKIFEKHFPNDSTYREEIGW